MTDLHLIIEMGSDPISGWVEREGSESTRFVGWIELVSLIESARDPRHDAEEQRLGSFPGVNAAES